MTETWSTVKFSEAPPWYRFNEYIRTGYRPALKTFKDCFLSIFRIHNETVNIWSHLIPGVACLLAIAHLLMCSDGNDCGLKTEKRFGMVYVLVGCMTGLITSSVAHVLFCKSEEVSSNAMQADVIGVILQILGHCLSWAHYALNDSPWTKFVYFGFAQLYAFGLMLCLSRKKYLSDAYAAKRGFLATSFGILTAYLPAGYHMITQGIESGALFNLVISLLSFSSSVVFYITRIPEKLFPGSFDIWFHSHQIFHVLVVCGSYFHIRFIIAIAETQVVGMEEEFKKIGW